MKTSLRQAFQKQMERRYSLRLHMTLMLLATSLSGIVFSKLLLAFGLGDLRIRYALAVVSSYFVFFACVKLWLRWIASIKEPNSGVDWLDLPLSSPGGTGNVAASIDSGGGEFLGAGASASFEKEGAAFVGASVQSGSSTLVEGVSTSGIGDVVGDAAEAVGDDNIITAALVLVALIGTVLISAFLLLYGAPAILGEAAFQGVLAVSLAKRTKSISDKGWAGSIFRATWKPFAATLIVAIAGGVALHHFFPKAVRLADILWRI
jgi:hypothetical protein